MMMRFLFLLLLIVPTLSWADDDHLEHRTLSVTGKASVQAVPDQLVISLRVEKKSADLKTARLQHTQTVSEALGYMTEKLNIPEKHIQSDHVRIYPRYDNCSHAARKKDNCDPLKVIFYTLEQGIQVTLEDFDQYGPLMIRMLDLGVTGVDNVRFMVKDIEIYQDQARLKAAEIARVRANEIAGVLDAKVIRPLTIRVDQVGAPPMAPAHKMMRMSAMADVAEAAPMVAPGESNISAQVHVVFEIE